MSSDMTIDENGMLLDLEETPTTDFKDAIYEGISLNIQVLNDVWNTGVPDIETFCPLVVNAAFRMVVPGHADTEIALVLANNVFIHDLNLRYRGKDKPTNVLSFPTEEMQDDDGVMTLGDIVFGYETLIEECATQKKEFKDHFAHLLVHGVLHLLGFDHIEESDAVEMESLEIKILQELSIKNPYEND
ncbi:MAG: rRNA maturation RNase YbeY [Alphaproteobacteria bacterium]